jgi:hypothetical protein
MILSKSKNHAFQYDTNQTRPTNKNKFFSVIFLGFLKSTVPNWKEGKGGESSWSQRFLPLRRAETTVLPRRAASKSEGETPSMTLVSFAMTAFFIFFPTQCSSTASLAASTSGSSGILLRRTDCYGAFARFFRRRVRVASAFCDFLLVVGLVAFKILLRSSFARMNFLKSRLRKYFVFKTNKY